MSNYEYIISSLPYLTPGSRYAEGRDFSSTIEEIRRDLSEKDGALLDFLLDGFDPEKLGEDFYCKALRHRNRFIREYFRFDLNLRNAKVEFLNARLGRAPGEDVVTGDGAGMDFINDRLDIDLKRFSGGEFEENQRLAEILSEEDLLEREKKLDDIVWDKINALTVFNYFDIEAVLGYVAKLHIADRWLVLDEQAGREKFAQLVKEVKGTFKGINKDSI
ncbi:MAG: DUF2764 family protein [Bacteroidales bacterium]|nr:DUF2764 family protein [Bacteroidales bacterium]